MNKRLTLQQVEIVKELYRSGFTPLEIKEKMNFSYHQPIFNVLKKIPDYIPYRNGRNSSRKYHFNERYFDIIDSEEKAYFLGFICADGSLDLKHKRLRIALQKQDHEILEKIISSIGSNREVIYYTKQSNFSYGRREFQMCYVDFCSEIMINSLANKGLNNRKSDTLNSGILTFVPDNLIRHFLRGYFDGDGNIMFGRKYLSGIKYNINICGNLEFLENTFGKYFPTSNKYYKDKISKQCWVYKISSKERVVLFLKYLYDNSSFYLQRKYNIYLIACGHLKPIELLETRNLIIIDDIDGQSAAEPLYEEGSETIETLI
jgi:hypothetical protein